MKYKLIALDVDGTIRSFEQPPSARMRKAIDAAVRSGTVVTLATGRMFRSAAQAGVELGLTAPVISYQGSLVGDPVSRQVLWHVPLTREMALQALVPLEASGLHVNMYIRDEIYVAKATTWAEGYAARNGTALKTVGDLSSMAHQEPTKLIAVGDEEDVDRLCQDMVHRFGTSLLITKGLPRFCEVGNPKAGKANALKWLCGHLGIRQEETLAFGNDFNDVDMLQWVGLGIAMEGSPEEVLTHADRVAPSFEEDGAAQVLEELLARGAIGA